MKHSLTTTLAAVLLLGCHVDSIYTGPVEQAMFDDVRAGNIEDVKKFLDDGGNVNSQDEPGCTPLHWAVNEDFKGSHRDMVELLIANGADVNAVDDIQTTPLHLASYKETAEILINAGANVNAQDHEGRTLLFAAARNAANASQTWEMYLNLVKLLIGKDAELSTKDNSGQTPLHLVAGSFDEGKASEICDLLLSSGANLNVINDAGQTPLDVATHEDRIKTAEHLRRFGGKTAEELTAEGK